MGGVRRDQVCGRAAVGEFQRKRACRRGLAGAALADDEDEATVTDGPGER
jgi:hypothetical protein